MTDAVQRVSFVNVPGQSAAGDRHTEYGYDWRDRLIVTKQGAQTTENTADNTSPITWLTLDNLGEVTSVQQYDGDGLSLDTNADGVPDQPSASLLRAQTTTQYDGRGRVFSSEVWDVDPTLGGTPTAGLVTGYWYDRRGNLIKTSAPGGLVTKTTYDGANRPMIVYQTDGGGDQLSGSTDSSNWSGATTVDGDIVLTQTETQYDGDGNVVLVTTRDRFHDALTTDKGPLGNPLSTDPTAKARVSFVAHYYDAADRLIADADVGTNYDPANQDFTLYENLTGAVPTRSDTALVTSYGYDDAGFLRDVIDPRGITTRTVYDALGRTTKTIQAYDPNSPSPFHPNNVITDYAYDGSNHLTSVIAETQGGAGGSNQTTTYTYGVSTTDGIVHSNINSKDVLYSTTYPPAGTGVNTIETYAVNAQGERTSFTDRNETTHTYTHDVLGRLTSDAITVATGNPQGIDTSITSLGYTFDSAGRPFQFTSYNDVGGIVNQVERFYNGFGQLWGEYQEHNGAVNPATTPEVNYDYTDPANRIAPNRSLLAHMYYPDGYMIEYTYDSVGRLRDSQEGGTDNLETYSYLGLHTMGKTQRGPDGFNVALTYVGTGPGEAGDQYTGIDRFGRIIDQRWIDESGNDIDRYKYAYDRDGNVLYKINVLSASNSELYQTSGNTEPNSAYDSLNRLTNFVRGTLSDSNSDGYMDTSTGSGKAWDLDVLGNWNNVTGETGDRQTNSQNEVTQVNGNTLTYDANGNSITNQSGGTLVYDGWNRLVSVTPSGGSATTYANDALGHRIIESPAGGTTTDLYYSDQWQVIEERQGGNVTSRYVWSANYTNALVFRQQDSNGNGLFDTGEQLWVTYDANYNVTSVMGADAPMERFTYDPYGNTRAVFGSTWSATTDAYNWTYGFQGGRYDPESGLYLFNIGGHGRDYDPDLGRWIEQDHAGYVDGYNLYQMERSDPATLLDPYGRDPNQKDAVTPGWLVRQAKAIEAANPGLSPCSVMDKLRDRFNGSPKYIYTTSRGWLDLNHFFNSAHYARGVGGGTTYLGGILVEVGQAIIGGVVVPFIPGIGSSAFNREDLPSNTLGIEFSWHCDGCGALSKKLDDFLKKAGAVNPRLAPDWNRLRGNEGDHEDEFQQHYADFWLNWYRFQD